VLSIKSRQILSVGDVAVATLELRAQVYGADAPSTQASHLYAKPRASHTQYSSYASGSCSC
jgi:hypothetical protein